ncbi:AmiR/NasT family two-component response regulator [Oxalobacteraceae bacterium GrIS 1.11]
MNLAPDEAGTLPPKRQILLVDDDMLILGLLSQFLQRAGHDTRIATSGQMALDMLAESGREPDLALLDISMPGMSGLDLARHMQADTTVPLMFLSASENADIVKQAAACGAVGYLVKPIDMAQLSPSIEAALARGDEIRQLRETEIKLTHALQSGREIGMAVGVLMERYKTDRDTAFAVLRDHARSQRRKLNDVAQELLTAAEALNLYIDRFVELARPRR